jgi:hypothetical protein
MKYTKYIMILFVTAIFVFAGCKKEYNDPSVSIESAPEIELLGPNPVFVLKGLPYTEYGIHTIEYANGDTIDDHGYTVLGKVNTDLLGTYTLTYEVKNVNNVSFYKSRTVTVVEFTGYDVFEIPSGTYAGLRVGRGGGDVSISKIRAGIYSVSDLLGGYYDQYVGYGPEYAAPALFIIDSDGSIRSELGYCGFGNVAISGATFDAATNKISYRAILTDQGNFAFNVTLTLK